MYDARGSAALDGDEGGYVLLLALLVLAILATLGASLELRAGSEWSAAREAMSRSQALDATESLATAAEAALRFDFERDVNGWADRWLVVCDTLDTARCRATRGVDPLSVPCHDDNDERSCIRADGDGTLTGTPGQWVVDLAWRPGGVPAAFPSLAALDLEPALRDALPWWPALDEGARGGSARSMIALTSVCVSGCASASPDFAHDALEVRVVASSDRRVAGRLTQARESGRGALRVRLQGTSAPIHPEPSVVRTSWLEEAP